MARLGHKSNELKNALLNKMKVAWDFRRPAKRLESEEEEYGHMCVQLASFSYPFRISCLACT